MHLTGGTLRVFKPFSWLKAGSAKVAFSHPAHQRVPTGYYATASRWIVLCAMSQKSNSRCSIFTVLYFNQKQGEVYARHRQILWHYYQDVFQSK